MDKQDRELLLKSCELFREMAELQLGTHRAVRTLFLALKTQLPNLEEAYRTARTDSLFATEESSKVNRMILEIEDTISRLKKEALNDSSRDNS